MLEARPWSLLLLAALIPAAAPAGESPGATVDRLLATLTTHSVVCDTNRAVAAALRAVLLSVDDGARLLSRDEAERLGRAPAWGPPISLTPTGAVLVAGFDGKDRPAVSNALNLVIGAWERDICYLRIPTLVTGVAEQVAASLASLDSGGSKSLLLDLRGAGGNDIAAVARISSLFPGLDGALFRVIALDGEERVVEAGAGMPLWTHLVVVLADETTREAAELLAALMKAHPGVLMVGRNTSGDSRVREILPFSDAFSLYVATRHLRLASGEDYAGVGVAPHIAVEPDASAGAMKITDGTDDRPLPETSRHSRELLQRVMADPALGRGTAILLGLKALGVDGGDHGATPAH